MGGGEQAANPLPVSPARGWHTLSVALPAAAGGGVRRGRDALALTHTRTRTHRTPLAPLSLPARPAPSLSLSRSGCFVGGRRGARRARPPARQGRAEQSGAERHIHRGRGRFQTAAIAAPLFAGRAAPPPFVRGGRDWPAPGGALPSPLGKPIHLCTWALDSASY